MALTAGPENPLSYLKVLTKTAAFVGFTDPHALGCDRGQAGRCFGGGWCLGPALVLLGPKRLSWPRYVLRTALGSGSGAGGDASLQGCSLAAPWARPSHEGSWFLPWSLCSPPRIPRAAGQRLSHFFPNS